MSSRNRVAKAQHQQQHQQHQQVTSVTFRPDFCSPAYLNGLLRLQHLHWLEIRRRPCRHKGRDGAVTAFLFVIPASLSNLVCVLGTEVPFLEAELGCRLRQIPVPDYIAPDGLKAFGVDFAERPAPGSTSSASASPCARFLSALRSICVRLQLANICVDPAAYLGDRAGGGGGGGCQACAKVRTHTKSVRGASAARLRQRPRPPLTLCLARPRMRRPASAEAAAAAAASAAAAATAAAGDADRKAAQLADSAAGWILDRLAVPAAAVDTAALSTAAASVTLRVISGFSHYRPRWRQFGLDFSAAGQVADAVVAGTRLGADVSGVFAEWAAELADCLLAGCVSLAADVLAEVAAGAAAVTDTAAEHLVSGLTCQVAAEMADAGQAVVRISLPCDWRTSRALLLGLQEPVRRRCPACGAFVTAEPAGATGYRLTVRSRGGQRCSRHGSLLQVADCARSSKDAQLGGLLLQEVAALPAREGKQASLPPSLPSSPAY